MNEKITVIVKMYNCEKTITRCLNSLVNQTYKNLDVILMNDGSKDNTREIAESFMNKYANFRLINQQNQGIASTANNGLDLAKGDYIIFLDQDDYAEPNAYEIMINLAIQNDADMVICDYKRTSGKDNSINFITPGVYERDEIFYHFLDDSITAHVWNKLCKKTIYDGVRFNKNKIYEDMSTTYELAYKSKKIVITGEKLFIYTDSNNQNSISFDNSIAERKDADIASSYREKYYFAIRNKVSNLERFFSQVALYNTNYYRNYHKEKKCEKQIMEIRGFFNENKDVFLKANSVDLIRKFFILVITRK